MSLIPFTRIELESCITQRRGLEETALHNLCMHVHLHMCRKQISAFNRYLTHTQICTTTPERDAGLGALREEKSRDLTN